MSVSSEMYVTEEEKEIKKKITINAYENTFLYLSSVFTNYLNFLPTLKLEVLFFAFRFGYMMKSVTSVTMIMEKVCRVDIGFEEDVCAHLGDLRYKDFKIKVEITANDYHLYHSLISYAPAVILACFLGPWSDKYGRKPPLILAMTGGIIDGIGSVICAYFMNSSAKYYLIPPIFSGFSGGFITVCAVAYSYASDVTKAKSRTFKYALLEIAMGLSGPLGGVAGGQLFKYSGYVTVFSVMVICFVFGLVWVVFALDETRGMDNKDTVKQKARNLFRLSSLRDSYRVTAKKRPNKGRIQIWILFLATSILILALSADAVRYIYVYHLFNWSNTKYSTVSSIYSALGFISILISVPLFTKVFKMGDPLLGIIGSLSLIAQFLGIGLAVYGEWIYHLASLLGVFSSLGTLASRSRISKIVSKDELGKVFSFMSSAEGLLPIATTFLFTSIFNTSVKNNNPGLTFYVVSAIMSINVAIFLWFACLPSVNYEEMHEESENKNSEELESPART